MCSTTVWSLWHLTKNEYLFVPLHARYAGAEWGCIAYGGRLVVITSEDEDMYLRRAVPVPPPYNETHGITEPNAYMIGLRRGFLDCVCSADDEQCEECRLSFIWDDGITPTNYTNWFGDGSVFEPSTVEKCVVWAIDGWHVNNCYQPVPYLCKRVVSRLK